MVSAYINTVLHYNIKENPKKIWQNLNSIINKVLVMQLKIDGTNVTEPIEIAESLNDYCKVVLGPILYLIYMNDIMYLKL